VRTYEDVAAYYDVSVCPSSGQCNVSDTLHHRGHAQRNTVHWSPRRLSKPGLRNFLRLVAQTRLLRYAEMNKAMRIYAENVWIDHASRDLRVRFPRRYSESDRAKTRWLESQGQTLTIQAHRWAHRQESQS
jgi:hypothetical protein